LVDIFFTYFSEELPSQVYNSHLEKMPAEMQEKNAAYHFWEDRHSHLFGRLLKTFAKREL
jgi:4'-phosphopantetheinyl transferase